jgi:hypothetical protein
VTQNRDSIKGKYRLESRAVCHLVVSQHTSLPRVFDTFFPFFLSKYLLISSLSFIPTHAHFFKFMSVPFSVDLRLILLSQLAFLLCQFKQPLIRPSPSTFQLLLYCRIPTLGNDHIPSENKQILTLPRI